MQRDKPFDENPDLVIIQEPRYASFFNRLSEITQEYWLHQLAKMHDPAKDKVGNVNLTIDYMLEYGDWDEDTKSKLGELREQMDALSSKIKEERNKRLSHNDLAIIKEAKNLGAFDPGADVAYFR
jgi:AbiU2